ncbi:SRPBCC family protein [Agromyces sp. SYSU T0242]|uniref:SRPBCC family protein n=1 Tax=Agromyces litoreus TaxID=3158561 RepID=UPI0033985A4B
MNGMTEQAPAIVLERDVDAPVEAVWEMWTDPQHFAAWYGPTGSTITVVEFDVRPGGTRTIRMDVPTPDGPRSMWFSGTYLDVVPHERLAYTEFISDERGEAVSTPGGPNDPTEVRVEFRGDGERTALVLTHLGVPAGSPGETGWRMALDALDARLRGERASR